MQGFEQYENAVLVAVRKKIAQLQLGDEHDSGKHDDPQSSPAFRELFGAVATIRMKYENAADPQELLRGWEKSKQAYSNALVNPETAAMVVEAIKIYPEKPAIGTYDYRDGAGTEQQATIQQLELNYKAVVRETAMHALFEAMHIAPAAGITKS